MTGLLGAVLVAVWAKGLIAETGKVLLDREMDHPVVEEIREVVQACAAAPAQTRFPTMQVWRVGKNGYSCALSLVTQVAGLTPGRQCNRLHAHQPDCQAEYTSAACLQI